jgi:hypothetical protein
MPIRTRLERVEKQVARLVCPRCGWPAKDSREQEQIDALRLATVEELRTLKQIQESIAERRAQKSQFNSSEPPPH